MNAIELRDITKTFGTHTAVAPLTLDVPEGTIYGFIGPNGSGKTTTIRMIMNILVPDSGRISVNTTPPRKRTRTRTPARLDLASALALRGKIWLIGGRESALSLH